MIMMIIKLVSLLVNWLSFIIIIIINKLIIFNYKIEKKRKKVKNNKLIKIKEIKDNFKINKLK